MWVHVGVYDTLSAATEDVEFDSTFLPLLPGDDMTYGCVCVCVYIYV